MRQNMSEDQKFIFDSIYTQVRSGFYSIEDIQSSIIDEIDDNGCADEVSEEWAFEQIDNMYEELLQESASWPTPTYTQRLVAAFDELAESKMIALHFPGYDHEDGEYEAEEVERTLIDNGTKSEGYCFYTGHDLDKAIKGEGLSIHFQKLNNVSDAVSKEVANKIVEILRKHDFEVVWNNKANSPIFLPNFTWQKVYNEEDRDLLNYNHVIEMILEYHK